MQLGTVSPALHFLNSSPLYCQKVKPVAFPSFRTAGLLFYYFFPENFGNKLSLEKIEIQPSEIRYFKGKIFIIAKL